MHIDNHIWFKLDTKMDVVGYCTAHFQPYLFNITKGLIPCIINHNFYPSIALDSSLHDICNSGDMSEFTH